MSNIDKFVKQIKTLLQSRGENLSNYEFFNFDEKRVIVTKNGTHHIINIENLNNEQIKNLKTVEINKLINLKPTKTKNMGTYDLDACEKNWIKLAYKQIKQNPIDDNHDNHDNQINNDEPKDYPYRPPVGLEFIHFDEFDVISVTGHILKAYAMSSNTGGLDILIVPGFLSSHVMYTNILSG